MTDFQIWVEVLMLILSVIFVSVFGRFCLCPSKEQWEIGIFAVLLVWLDFIIFIRYLQLHVFDIGNALNFRAAACSVSCRIIVFCFVFLRSVYGGLDAIGLGK